MLGTTVSALVVLSLRESSLVNSLYVDTSEDNLLLVSYLHINNTVSIMALWSDRVAFLNSLLSHDGSPVPYYHMVL